MKKVVLSIVAILFMFLPITPFYSCSAEAEQTYTIEDLENLQNFLLGKETPDLSGKDYDLCKDGRWDVFDLVMMRSEVAKTLPTQPQKKENLVAYYSASGTTDRIAQFIAEEMNADIFVITPVEEYTSADLDWTDSESRVMKEHNDPDRHTELISVTPENFADYDNVFIGYPIWWHAASWVVNDFVTENDFTGKNVIPFCTSISSPLGDSGEMLAELCGTGNWIDGMRFTSYSTQSEVKSWLDTLDLQPVVDTNVLVAFFSRADENYDVGYVEKGNTHILAEMIADKTGGDLFHIQTVTPYPAVYSECTAYVKQEKADNARPELNAVVEDMEQYGIIYLGYPIWWGDMPMAMYTFLESYDFSGKTIIPFCTHEGSGLSGTPNKIQSACPDVN